MRPALCFSNSNSNSFNCSSQSRLHGTRRTRRSTCRWEQCRCSRPIPSQPPSCSAPADALPAKPIPNTVPPNQFPKCNPEYNAPPSFQPLLFGQPSMMPGYGAFATACKPHIYRHPFIPTHPTHPPVSPYDPQCQPAPMRANLPPMHRYSTQGKLNIHRNWTVKPRLRCRKRRLSILWILRLQYNGGSRAPSPPASFAKTPGPFGNQGMIASFRYIPAMAFFVSLHMS